MLDCQDEKPHKVFEESNLDDLDSVLNFEAKEFNDLVLTMNHVLSVNHNTTKPPATTVESDVKATIPSNKDQKLNDDFLLKSM